MTMSDFDVLMVEADQALMDTFGTECLLILAPDTEPIPVQVDIERGLTVQQLGERGRSGNGSRLAQQVVGSILATDAPANISTAVLVADGVRYKLTEPMESSGEIEYLLILETTPDQSGSKTSTFL